MTNATAKKITCWKCGSEFEWTPPRRTLHVSGGLDGKKPSSKEPEKHGAKCPFCDSINVVEV